MDAFGRLLVVILTPVRPADNPQLLPLLDALSGLSAQGRTLRVERVIGDTACAHRPTRQALRRGGIKATIPERLDQIRHRKTKGSAGGRPPAFDPEIYRQRNVVERCINRLKQLRAFATRPPATPSEPPTSAVK